MGVGVTVSAMVRIIIMVSSRVGSITKVIVRACKGVLSCVRAC